MSAMTRSPACVSAGGSTSGIFGAASVTVIDASIGDPLDRRAVRREPGRQVDGDDRHAEPVDVGDDGLEQPRQRAAKTGAEDRIDDERRNPRARVKCSSHSCALVISTTVMPRRPRTSRLVRASPRTSATLPRRKTDVVDAALRERARDHESVAAVVAAAAEDRDAARRQVVEGGFHGRHDLASGVLHEHDRRNPDVLDGAAIGLAHLFGVEHSHGPGRAYCLC